MIESQAGESRRALAADAVSAGKAQDADGFLTSFRLEMYAKSRRRDVESWPIGSAAFSDIERRNTVVNKIMGNFLKVLAVVVWVQFLAILFYDPAQEGVGFQIWSVLDPLMVIAMLITIWFAFRRKVEIDSLSESSLSRDYIETNIALYGGIALLAALLWNWIGSRWSYPLVSFQWLWILIDLTLPLLLFSVGRRLTKTEAL
ncbi:MAG: hypothetical protein OXF50_00075 [Caldilineaceae bacterium]|nr:hypothetical protein [Caldilineaceae bacterium]